MPITPSANRQDALRPTSLDDFAGQPAVSTELAIILGATKARGEAVPPHLLFSGPPGLGKTTLAGIVAAELGLPLITTAGPQMEKPGDLIGILVPLNEPTVVFVDEIHRLPRTVEETLYSAMEDGRVDITVAQDANRVHVIPMDLKPFVLIGATTNVGMLTAPFRDRFGYVGRLKPYDEVTLAGIVQRSAGLLDVNLSPQAAAIIASRSRGTPRIANRLLRRVRDYAQLHSVDAQVSAATASDALARFGVDERGLDEVDRELLTALAVTFGGRPVGVDTLAATLGETSITVAEMVEPYLMRAGLMARTKQGRVATAAAWRHLGLPVPPHALTDEQTLAQGPDTADEDGQLEFDQGG